MILIVIDEISYKTFRYRPIDNDHDRGGFDWKLFHYWIGPADAAVGSRWVVGQKDTDAFPSPTMIGVELLECLLDVSVHCTKTCHCPLRLCLCH